MENELKTTVARFTSSCRAGGYGSTTLIMALTATLRYPIEERENALLRFTEMVEKWMPEEELQEEIRKFLT